MSKHLTQSELTLLRQRAQTLTDWPRICQHLAECHQCQQLVSEGQKWQPVVAFVRGHWLEDLTGVDPKSICLTTAELAHYLNHTLTNDESETVAEHLRQCHECAQALETVKLIERDRLLKLEYTPPRKTGWQALWDIPAWRYSLPSVAAALLLVVFAYIVLEKQAPTVPSSLVANVPIPTVTSEVQDDTSPVDITPKPKQEAGIP